MPNQERDIYAEIDLEDLHGPSAETTIPIDVQDDQVALGTNADDSSRGVLPGKSDEVSNLMQPLIIHRIQEMILTIHSYRNY